MVRHDWMQICIFVLLLIIIAPLLGSYLSKIYQGKQTYLKKRLGWLERLSYRIAGVDPQEEMTWKAYGKALLWFNGFGFIALFAIQLFQGYLPFNPQHFQEVPWDLAFNTAASFVTNTNWQSYAGETTLSYATQMVGLTVQNFLSAATGVSALLVLIRGITRKTSNTIGNFWADLIRTLVYVLLPLSIVFSVVLVSEGVIQTLAPYVEVETLEKGKQTLPLGPVASQIAIKQLGTNGGGFYNTNSAHPFENPTTLSNFLELFAILLLPAALIFTFGFMTGAIKHAWLLFSVMLFLWACGLGISLYSEHLHNPALQNLPVLEGKETRFGILNSVLWSVSTTATANGSVNCMLSSLTPLSGCICMFNIMLGELVFGGAGVGLLSMIFFVLLTVFLSGLMVGRTPEYLGKKIEKRDMQYVVIAVLMPGALILLSAGISCVLQVATSSLLNHGPHGLSEILYASTSATGNNGSAFAGLNANTVYYNILLGIIMLLGRTAILFPSLAIAGHLAQKKITPPSVGTFSTDTLLFALLLIGSILIIGALTYSPAQLLGPIIEHFLMIKGRVF